MLYLKSFEKSEPQLCIGDNKPYIGKLPGDTIDKHAIKNQRLNTLIEIRNDLIKTEIGAKSLGRDHYKKSNPSKGIFKWMTQ